MLDEVVYVIGVDNGNGSVKTVNKRWFSEVKEVENTLTENVIELDGKLYELGAKPSEYKARKFSDEALRVQTLAAIATELDARGVSEEQPAIHLALGLPIGHWGRQKDKIKEYFAPNTEEEFWYKSKFYSIRIADCNVMPQGLASTRRYRHKEVGNTITLDIGYGTLDYLTFHNSSLSVDESGSLEYGISKCYEQVRKAIDKEFAEVMDFFSFENYIRGDRKVVNQKWHPMIDTALKEYCKGVISEAKRIGYNPNTCALHLMGGGANIMKVYADLEGVADVSFDLDVHSNAKCFESFCKQALRKQGVDFYE